MAASVIWPPIAAGRILIRPAEQKDVPTFQTWDRDPDIIAATSDDPDAAAAFEALDWAAEIAARSDIACCYIAELDGRPIGGMQVIDPHLEPTHYWGEIEPNLRAVDIWIGDAADRNAGHGRTMMTAVIDRCFADPAIIAIVIDPLASNVDAHRFYRRLGFKPVGKRRFGDDDCLVHRLDRAVWRKGT